MIWFIAKKVLYSLFVVFSVATILFFLFDKTYPNPEEMAVGQRADKATKQAIREEFGLDKPLFERYIAYINDISIVSIHKRTADFQNYKTHLALNIGSKVVFIKTPYLRKSFQNRQPVSGMLLEAFKGTFILAISAISLAMVLGFLLGILASLNLNTPLDQAVLFISNLGISIPSFFAAIIISWLFGYVLHSQTGLNMTGNLYDLDAYNGKILVLKNLILPTLALGLRPAAIITLLTRSTFIETLQKDYIKTARSKGLSSSRILIKHALPNAVNPVITAISGWFASLLAGAFFIEYIFNWRGIGKVTIEALEKNDLPLVMAALLMVSFIFVIINLFVDLIYVWLDPRIDVK